MTTDLDHLLASLLALPHETEWVEFKHNNADPDEIGEYVSALANAAALHGKERAYLISFSICFASIHHVKVASIPAASWLPPPIPIAPAFLGSLHFDAIALALERSSEVATTESLPSPSG